MICDHSINNRTCFYTSYGARGTVNLIAGGLTMFQRVIEDKVALAPGDFLTLDGHRAIFKVRLNRPMSLTVNLPPNGVWTGISGCLEC